MRIQFCKTFTLLLLCCVSVMAEKIPEEMVLVPMGEFEMGTHNLDELVTLGSKVPHMSIGHAETWFGDERPEHTVIMPAFYIDKFEVTNSQFHKFIEETGYDAEGDWEKYAGKNRQNHPVVNVTWNDANEYAVFAGKELPTEQQYEYAAQGGQKLDNMDYVPDSTQALWRHQGESFWAGLGRLFTGRKINTAEVDTYPPNSYGIFHVCGNVREWTHSDYAPYPGLTESMWQHTDFRPFSSENNKKLRKVARGGSWNSPNPVFIRISVRTPLDPSYSSNELGFRCVKKVSGYSSS